MTDIWYREYLAVAAQLDAMTAERDAARADLAACKERENAEWVKAIDERNQARTDLAAARELLKEAHGWLLCHDGPTDEIIARIDAALDATASQTRA